MKTLKYIIEIAGMCFWLAVSPLLAYGQAPTHTPVPTATVTKTPTARSNFQPHRDDGCVSVPDATAVEVGIGNTYRDELLFRNLSADTVYCGHDAAALNASPGANSGMPYASGEGASICQYADLKMYCVCGGSNCLVCYTEARQVTPTPVP